MPLKYQPLTVKDLKETLKNLPDETLIELAPEGFGIKCTSIQAEIDEETNQNILVLC